MTEIVNDWPTNIAAIRAVLPVTRGNIFAYGGKIYSPGSKTLAPELIAHEQVHFRQQGDDPDILANGDIRITGNSAGRYTMEDIPVTTIVGAGALVIAVVVAARFWVGARRSSRDEDWVAAIARLDDEYEAGELSEEDWRRQREPLKRQALDRMSGSDD